MRCLYIKFSNKYIVYKLILFYLKFIEIFSCNKFHLVIVRKKKLKIIFFLNNFKIFKKYI
jgi:hypothetical protein